MLDESRPPLKCVPTDPASAPRRQSPTACRYSARKVCERSSSEVGATDGAASGRHQRSMRNDSGSTASIWPGDSRFTARKQLRSTGIRTFGDSSPATTSSSSASGTPGAASTDPTALPKTNRSAVSA